MSSEVSTENWTRPDELLRQQIKEQRLRKLQKRLVRPTNKPSLEPSFTAENVANQKRNNPFAKFEPKSKKIRSDLPELNEETLFELIHNTAPKSVPNIEAIDVTNKNNQNNELFSVVYDENTADSEQQGEENQPQKVYQFKKLPVDWSLKSRIRILSTSAIVSNSLKSSQEASGLTAFVRCLNMKSTKTRLDISDGARFHQNVMYFQHPNLPWLNLIQRSSSTNNSSPQLGEDETKALIKDWKESFFNLFQLLRTLQCPYFYVLANQFSVLFRAGGIGGHCEMHAFMTPTTRGFRQLLKNEEIEFSLLLKNSTTKDDSNLKNDDKSEELEEEEEEDEFEFLESLGVEASQIKFKDDLKTKQKEAEDDNGDMSTILIEGHDCQSFFNFILNDAKSSVTQVGRLAGIPPTLISPVAFHGGSLKKQSVKTSKLRSEGEDFYSVELKGAILPHTIHTLCNFISEIKENFSLTMTNYPNTVAFTKSSKKMINDLDSSRAAADHYFGRENLSDCGLENEILENLTRVDEDAVNILETLHYKKEIEGFTIL